jgi:hypothetical protein
MKQKTKSLYLPWPDEVFVLDGSYKINGPPGCDEDNYPQSLLGWLEYELRESCLHKVGHIDNHHVFAMYDFWIEHWHKMLRVVKVHNQSNDTRKSKVKVYLNRFSRYDHYNASWASLGYTDGQSNNAMTLLSLSK